MLTLEMVAFPLCTMVVMKAVIAVHCGGAQQIDAGATPRQATKHTAEEIIVVDTRASDHRQRNYRNDDH